MSKEVMQEESKTSSGKKRSFGGNLRRFVTILTVSLAVFQLYTAFFGLLPAMQQRSVHMAFVLPLIFLLYPMTAKSRRDRPSPLDWALAAMAAVCTVYIFVMYEDIANRSGMYEQYELYLGAAMIILVFEAARRALGYALPTFCGLFLFFGYFGRSMPGPFRHFGLSVPRIIEELLSDD